MRNFLEALDFTDGWGAVGAIVALIALLGAIGKWAWGRISTKAGGTDFVRIFEEGLKPQNWEITRGQGQLYVIRNLGPAPVSGLTFDEDRIECISRQMPKNVDLAVHEAYEFMLIGTMQTGGAPSQVWVRTDQEPEWRPVPMPA